MKLVCKKEVLGREALQRQIGPIAHNKINLKGGERI